MGWNDFSLPGCGETFDNEDGTSRQEELARCSVGESVALVREPDNSHDPAAVAIVTTRGVRVGYLRRDRAVWIGSKIDRGYDVRAIVERIRGAHLPGSPLGVLLRINMEGDDPELPIDADRAVSRAARIGSKIDKGLKITDSVDRLVGRRGDPIKPVIRIEIEAA